MQDTNEKRSNSFGLLHPVLQQWVWEKGWKGLHDAQERAIPLLLNAESDVIISASTAAGKTEAAFLPILSRLAVLPPEQQLVLQISPLKALINDQYQRLEIICDRLDIPVIPWHGDVSASKKKSFLKSPSRGVVLITPESLEALFVNKGSIIPAIFEHLQYVVVDELHVFIASERGRQLQSLLHRLEAAIGRAVPRVGLSATLGDMNLAARFLRYTRPVNVIESKVGGNTLLLSLKAFYRPALAPKNEGGEVKLDEALEPLKSQLQAEDLSTDDDEEESMPINDIARHIYRRTRDSKNLVFPNSRGQVEYYAVALASLCEADNRPNCYWPHHGNLSKEFREEVEGYLKRPDIPATGVATSTLELGLDIGDVKSVAQIGRPPSVSGLRQRLGRSGRKEGVPSILWAYSLLHEITKDSTPVVRLHTDLVQSIAIIQLLIQGWYEPPQSGSLHLSTLTHQMLSCIAQHSSRSARELWDELIETGPHKGLTKSEFRDLIIGLGKHDLIMQDADGSFMLGEEGERFVNHYEFYSVFALSDEYRIEHRGRVIGVIGKSLLIVPGLKFIFAGRRWVIESIDTEASVIYVERSRGGTAISFGGDALPLHDKIVEEMRSVLSGNLHFQYLDEAAKKALAEAREYYYRAELNKSPYAYHDGDLYVFTWRGGRITDTLAFALNAIDLEVRSYGYFLIAPGVTVEKFEDALIELDGIADIQELFSEIVAPEYNRWDWALPVHLRMKDFMARACNFMGMKELIQNLLASSYGRINKD